ncbi:MAG: ABC transporter permease subunit [bacterium]|nr:ABC transporter permease subunit [bacterium]
MWNVLKMDFYRMVHMKSFYVMLAVVMATFIFSAYVVKVAEKEIAQVTASSELNAGEAGAPVGSGVGISISNNGMDIHNADIKDWYSMMSQSRTLLLFVCIFGVLFVTSEQNSGFIKNTVTQVSGRYELILSKLVVMASFVIISSIVTIIGIMISQQIFYNGIKVGNLASLLSYVSVSMLIQLAASSLIILLTTLLKSTAFSMLLAVCISMNLFSIVIDFADSMIGTTKLADYSLINAFSRLPLNYEQSSFLKIIMTCVVYLCAYAGLSMFVFHKQDIR